MSYGRALGWPLRRQERLPPATAALTAVSDWRSRRRDRLQRDGPRLEDGRHLWRVARVSGTLDLNSPYSYVLLSRDFSTTFRARPRESPD